MSLKEKKEGRNQDDAGSEVMNQEYGEGPSFSDHPSGATEGLHRGLKARHMAMISIGSVVGTGIFLGSATSLSQGGPASLFLGYLCMGSLCISVMLSLGEMCSYLPLPGGHIKLAERFVDPSLSFALGWNYWYNWIVTCPAELSACAILISFWNKTVSPAVWISIVMIVVIAINLLGSRGYGEAEFWFSSIKVLTIMGLIVLGIILDQGGGPKGEILGFKYWSDPGPFVQYEGIPGALGRFLGFWSVLINAAFAFIGCEIVAVTAGEAKNPRRNIPKAIRNVYFRIGVFYILGTLVISVLVPSDEPSLSLKTSTAAKSPFVIAIRNAGIKTLPSIINAAILTSAASAASSDIYTSSRALHSLACLGQAPRIFKWTTNQGLPLPALIVSNLFALLAYCSISESSAKVFGYFSAMSSLAGMLTWACICFTYIRFHRGMKVQGFDRSKLPFVSPLQPYLAYYALGFILVIILTQGFPVFLKGNWDTPTFVTSYLPAILFPLLYFGNKLYNKSTMVRSEEMDFLSDIKEIEQAEEEEQVPTTWHGKLLSRLA
ncbi:amino acid permease [Violaceomyces palustris]|uniref:Amino acid permease n=1 Tax=Violaceomyces palustris TaxID=1673888 RepID=A0ACD0NSR7_9BASI|nr:amino acid permease [Violaceomyces palustris]